MNHLETHLQTKPLNSLLSAKVRIKSAALCLLLLVLVGQKALVAQVFPEDFVGSYYGTLSIASDTREAREIPMEFHLKATDTLQRYTYTLVYAGQARNYNLIEIDKETGRYQVDENNGIILDTRFSHNTLFSFFEVEDNFLSSRLAFQGDSLHFEILFTPTPKKVETGENLDLKVYSYPITTIQKALLIKKE